MKNQYELIMRIVNDKASDVTQIYDALLSALGYKDSENFHSSNEKISESDYDSEYMIASGGKTYPVVGIKALDSNDEESIIELHLKYWNKNDVPFSILILPNEIRVYNNFSIKENKLLFSSSSKKSKWEMLSLFESSKIISGALWEKVGNLISRHERVDYVLLESLKNTIILLHDEGMSLEPACDFLAQCIFVKYLEDRKMIGEKIFSKFSSENFIGLLEDDHHTALKEFFKYLKKRFNGDLFDLNVESELFPKLKQIRIVRNFFRGDHISLSKTHQISFFCYDFSIIPIELISNIYETFFTLGDKLFNQEHASSNGAYYTPYFLADFMVQKIFKDDALQNETVVLDPACGSGVFLVGTYKTLIERHIYNGNGIDGQTLKTILESNIFGIDKELKALKIACFSLYIALLDYMKPRDIAENEFKFPKLIGKTLYNLSFFDEDKLDISLKADIIIGNPPWKSDKNGDHVRYYENNKIPVSDHQIAQTFLARCRDFAHDSTIISLIVTNSIFTNDNAQSYRRYLLDNFKITEVLNLHHIKSTLFPKAKAPCSIITYKLHQEEQKDYKFNYFAFKPNIWSDILNKILYDNEEVILISKHVAINNDYIWYVLTYGDEFDFRVIKKLKKHMPMEEFISNSDNLLWCGRGFAVGNRKHYRPEYKEYRGGNLNNCFSKYAIHYGDLPFLQEEYYERPRSIDIYTYPCKLLIKRTGNKKSSGAALCPEPVIFTDDFYCIADIRDNEEDIRYLEALINSKVFNYYCIHASKLMIGIKPELSKPNLQTFPIPDPVNNTALVNDICEIAKQIEAMAAKQYGTEPFDGTLPEIQEQIERLQIQLDALIFKLYELNDIDIETINYTFSQILPSLQKKYNTLETIATDADYKSYSEYMCTYFNHILKSQSVAIKACEPLEQQICCIIAFHISSSEQGVPENDGTGDLLCKLPDLLGVASLESINNSMLVKKRIAGFLQDGFFVVKTRERKNWTKIAAIKDADYFINCIFKNAEGSDLH